MHLESNVGSGTTRIISQAEPERWAGGTSKGGMASGVTGGTMREERHHRSIAAPMKGLRASLDLRPAAPERAMASPTGPPRPHPAAPDTLHHAASDVNLPSNSPPPLPEQDYFKRAYSEGLLRSSTDGPRSPRSPTSPTDSGAVKDLHEPRRLRKAAPKLMTTQCAIPQAPTAQDLAEMPKALVKNTWELEVPKASLRKSQDTPAAGTSPLRRNGSWTIGSHSRSPSPKSRHVSEGARMPRSAERSPAGATAETKPSDLLSPPHRESSTSGKNRRLSSFLTRRKSMKGGDESSSPPTPSSATSSTDRLPLREPESSVPAVPGVPSLAAKERFQNAPVEPPRKKDELGSLFRSLDSDYQKFVSKPGTLKANVVRQQLLPFLRNYADHQSWRRLRPEDLDRRVNVLNKWWTALLEMLHGKSGQSVSASDRPAFLDAVSAIMVRPEWRVPASAMMGAARPRGGIMSRSSTSVDSNNSDFLVESVVSNARTVFTQNLLAQMAYVVDRMAARSTPASVVTFCGKATAYAFYYCPGIAEVLVRLWELPQDTFRRVLNEYGLHRNVGLREAAETVPQYFPSHLHPLVFSSVPKLVRRLRCQAPLILDSYIDWDGPWKSRWLGQETELFFCFTKHFNILLSNALPENATSEQRIAAPCALLVQAQLLAVMDSTVRGVAHEAHPEPFDGPLPVTFDDLLGPDASAETLPGRVPNANRSMAENRLIMLLRDFLSPSPAISEAGRRSFAVTFDALLKATAKRTSLYDHNACFSLCDFLEEAVAILSRYHGNTKDPGAFLDWEFWFQVLRQMGESCNSMTDIRLYSFLYSLWGYIARNPERKRELCVNWLLEEGYATRQLCHWCPMVRAYFMRLVCWRVVRYDGKASEVDLEIFKTAHTRLRDIWNVFLHAQARAAETKTPFLSTAPANPAPQRRFLIIRNDSAPAPATGFLSFDSMVAATASAKGGDYERPTESLAKLKQLGGEPEEAEKGRKRWSTLRGLNPFASGTSNSSGASKDSTSSNSTSTSGDATPTSTSTSTSTTTSSSGPPPISTARPAPSSSSSASASPSQNNGTTTPPSPSSPISPTHPHFGHETHSFKFALTPLSRPLVPPPRKLVPPNLPPPAQKVLQQAFPTPPPTQPRPPRPGASASAKYAGRALAEWAGLVEEARCFVERRLHEGVREPWGVEVPTLGVETFRRPVG